MLDTEVMDLIVPSPRTLSEFDAGRARHSLLIFKNEIIHHVNCENFIDELYKEGFISVQDVHNIKKGNTTKEKNSVFFSIFALHAAGRLQLPSQ